MRSNVKNARCTFTKAHLSLNIRDCSSAAFIPVTQKFNLKLRHWLSYKRESTKVELMKISCKTYLVG